MLTKAYSWALSSIIAFALQLWVGFAAGLTALSCARTAAAERTGAVQTIHAAARSNLARPTPVQYAWHEQERIMFVCLDPCTWQGGDYDNLYFP